MTGLLCQSSKTMVLRGVLAIYSVKNSLVNARPARSRSSRNDLADWNKVGHLQPQASFHSEALRALATHNPATMRAASTPKPRLSRHGLPSERHRRGLRLGQQKSMASRRSPPSTTRTAFTAHPRPSPWRDYFAARQETKPQQTRPPSARALPSRRRQAMAARARPCTPLAGRPTTLSSASGTSSTRSSPRCTRRPSCGDTSAYGPAKPMMAPTPRQKWERPSSPQHSM